LTGQLIASGATRGEGALVVHLDRQLRRQATIQVECPNGGNGNANGTVVWNNGKTSKIQGTFVVDQNQVGMSSIHVVSGEFAGDSGSFAGPITYLPWYQCVFPTGLQCARAIINQALVRREPGHVRGDEGAVQPARQPAEVRDAVRDKGNDAAGGERIDRLDGVQRLGEIELVADRRVRFSRAVRKTVCCGGNWAVIVPAPSVSWGDGSCITPCGGRYLLRLRRLPLRRIAMVPALCGMSRATYPPTGQVRRATNVAANHRHSRH
jgi:hypothetical protein